MAEVRESATMRLKELRRWRRMQSRLEDGHERGKVGATHEKQRREEDEEELYASCVDAVAKAVLALPPSAVLPRARDTERGRFFAMTARSIGLLRLKRDAEEFSIDTLRPQTRRVGASDDAAKSKAGTASAPSSTARARLKAVDVERLLAQLLHEPHKQQHKQHQQQQQQQQQHTRHKQQQEGQRHDNQQESKAAEVARAHGKNPYNLHDMMAFRLYMQEALAAGVDAADTQTGKEMWLRRQWRDMEMKQRQRFFSMALVHPPSFNVQQEVQNWKLMEASERAAGTKPHDAPTPVPRASVVPRAHEQNTVEAPPSSSNAAGAALPPAGNESNGVASERDREREMRLLLHTQCVARAKDANRTSLKYTLMGPPHGFTGHVYHASKLTNGIQGITFYVECHVADVDNPSRIMKFSIEEPEHCVCFNTGNFDSKGALRLTYSNLYALYKLPDGSAWAEHGHFTDWDDFEADALARNIDVARLKPSSANELVRRTGRFHTKVEYMEDECWIYPKAQFLSTSTSTSGARSHDSYFFSTTVDDETLTEVGDEVSIDKWPRPELPARRQYMTKKRKAEAEAEAERDGFVEQFESEVMHDDAR